MSRTSTTADARPERSKRKVTAHGKPAAGTSGSGTSAKQQKQPQAPSTLWQVLPIADDEQDELADWDDSGQSIEDSSKTRQRIEMLREERLLQQSLTDTFDF